MAFVTVPGTNGNPIGATFSNANSLALAQQIQNALFLASSSHHLNQTTVPPFGIIPPPPFNIFSNGINELIIDHGGSFTIPAGSAGRPDYLVVLDSSAPVTIVGGPNTTV
jgi:hypothetical protein